MSAVVVSPGQWVRIGENDADIPIGAAGLVLWMHEETGNPIVAIKGRAGRVALLPDQIDGLATGHAVPAPADGAPPPRRSRPLVGGVGAVLRDIRIRAGLSQMGLADRVDCASSYLSKLETGDRMPSLPFLAELAAALEMTAAERRALIEAAGFPLNGPDEEETV